MISTSGMNWKERAEYMKQKKIRMAAKEKEKQDAIEAEIEKYRQQRANLLFTDDDINSILDYVDETLLVEPSDIDESEGILEHLVGYKFSVDCTEGDHRNDGQMVDYEVTITNPKGKSLVFDTEMCLSVGWNIPWGTYDLKNMKFIRRN